MVLLVKKQSYLITCSLATSLFLISLYTGESFKALQHHLTSATNLDLPTKPGYPIEIVWTAQPLMPGHHLAQPVSVRGLHHWLAQRPGSSNPNSIKLTPHSDQKQPGCDRQLFLLPRLPELLQYFILFFPPNTAMISDQGSLGDAHNSLSAVG